MADEVGQRSLGKPNHSFPSRELVNWLLSGRFLRTQGWADPAKLGKNSPWQATAHNSEDPKMQSDQQTVWPANQCPLPARDAGAAEIQLLTNG